MKWEQEFAERSKYLFFKFPRSKILKGKNTQPVKAKRKDEGED